MSSCSLPAAAFGLLGAEEDDPVAVECPVAGTEGGKPGGQRHRELLLALEVVAHSSKIALIAYAVKRCNRIDDASVGHAV